MRTTFAHTNLAVAALAVLALAGCASTGGDAAAGGGDASIAGDWSLVSGTDAESTFEVDGPTVTLTIGEKADQNAGGVSACNTYGATIIGGPGTIEVGQVFQTEMACEPDSVMELESRYLAALAASTTAEIEGSELVLTGEGTALRFEPIDAAE